MISGFFRAAVVFTAGIVAGSMLLPALRPQASFPPELVTTSSAELALERPLAEVLFDRVPLREALADLARKSGVPIEVDWEATGLSEDVSETPVTLDRRGLPLADVLRTVLQQAMTSSALNIEPAGDRVRLCSSKEPLRRELTRVYDIRDLLRPKHGTTTAVNCSHLEDQRDDEEADRIVALLDSMRNADLSGNWRIDQFRFIGGRLLVVGDWEFHRGVRGALRQIREPDAAPDPKQVTSFPVVTWNPGRQSWLGSDAPTAEIELEKWIPELRLDDVTFYEALETLTRVSTMKLTVDQKDFERVSMDLSLRRSFSCPPGPAGDTLETILDAFAVLDHQQMGYTQFGEGIRIMIKDRSDLITTRRVYNIRDWPHLVRTVPDGEPTDTGESVEDFFYNLGALREIVSISQYRDALFVVASFQGQRSVRRHLATLRLLDESVPATRPTSLPTPVQGR